MARIKRTYENGTLTFRIGNLEPVEVNINDLRKVKGVEEFLLVHGASQKIGDNAAGAETDSDKRNALVQMVDRLMAGDLSRRAGGGGGGTVTVLEQALINLGYDEERIQVALADGATKKALQKHPQVQAEVAKIKAEKEKAKAKAATASAKTADSLESLLG